MKVKCINDKCNGLIKNKIYEVSNEDDCFYYILDKRKEERGYFKFRFEIVEENEIKYELKESFSAGNLWLISAGIWIEDFIKEFGFLNKISYLDFSIIEKMKKIDGCIDFLLKKGYIKKKEKFYSIGQFFLKNRIKYILAQVNYEEVCLISFLDGNRWVNPIKVENCYQITQDEFNCIKGSGQFTLIEE